MADPTTRRRRCPPGEAPSSPNGQQGRSAEEILASLEKKESEIKKVLDKIRDQLDETTVTVTDARSQPFEVSSSSAELSESNPRRRGFAIHNDTDTGEILIGLGEKNVTDARFFDRIQPGETRFYIGGEGFFRYTGAINAAWRASDIDAVDGKGMLTEFVQ